MFENKNSFVPPTFVGSNRAAMCSCTHKHRIIWPPGCWTACTLDVSIKVSFHVNCFSVAVWRRLSPKSSKFVAGWKQWPRTLFVFFCSNQNGKQSGWQAHYIHVRPHFHTYSPAVLRSLGRSFAIPLFPWPFRPFVPFPFCPTDGTFFNLRLPQWVIKWQRAKCSASPHPTDRRMKLPGSIQIQLEPVSNRFLLFCIYILLYPFLPPCCCAGQDLCRALCESGFGIVGQSRWPSPDIGLVKATTKFPAIPPAWCRDKFWLIRVFKLQSGVVQLPGTIVR